jgi:hypothetical protein
MVPEVMDVTTPDAEAMTSVSGANGARGLPVLTTAADNVPELENVVAKTKAPAQVRTKKKKSALMAAPKF